MLQIGYFSTARGAQDASTVHDILLKARVANRRDSITGLLVGGGGRYLQVFEGPKESVEALYGRIVKDDRHLAVTRFLRRDVAERSFGNWSMAYRTHAGGQADSFSDILAALTSEVADTGLKQKIDFFVRAMMSEQSSAPRNSLQDDLDSSGSLGRGLNPLPNTPPASLPNRERSART